MASGNFDSKVIAAHHGKSAADLQSLQVDGLKGVSAGDRQHLHSAFAIDTIGELAQNRFWRAARAIAEEAADIGHDPGPDIEWTTFFASAPVATYLAHPSNFRLDFGPVYYRGRLDGTARLLIVGQDPAPNELIGHRAFVGNSGQRLQGFLRKLGIGRDYIMVNTFLYPVFKTFSDPSLQLLSQNAEILNYRNAYFDRIADQNPLEAVITVGSAARDAVDRWPGSVNHIVQHIMHPAAHDTAALLASWNTGLAALRAQVSPESGFAIDSSSYGAAFTASDIASIPRRDLPFGVPAFHGVGSHAHRPKDSSGNTDHKRIVWTAP